MVITASASATAPIVFSPVGQATAAAGDVEGSLGHLLDAAADCGASTNARADALRTRIDWTIWAVTH